MGTEYAHDPTTQMPDITTAGACPAAITIGQLLALEGEFLYEWLALAVVNRHDLREHTRIVGVARRLFEFLLRQIEESAPGG